MTITLVMLMVNLHLKNLFSQLTKLASTLKRVLTSLDVARLAVQLRSPASIPANAKCMTQFVLAVVGTPRFLLSLVATNQFTATIAIVK